MRTLTIISGILMVIVSIFCLINPGQTFLSVAFIIGLVMIINGLIHTAVYLLGRGFYNRGDNNGWILTDALVTLVFGIFILLNQLVAEVAIPMVFGMWLLGSGILRIEASTHIDKKKKIKNFKITFITGMVTAIVGMLGFITPLTIMVSTTILVGVFLLIQGGNIIELGIHMPHEKKPYVKIYKRNRKPVLITSEEEAEDKVTDRLKEKEEIMTNSELGVIRNEDI